MSRARTLYDLLADADGLTVVCHDNPDPDCLSGALALGRIAAAAGVDERRILYSGRISHQQNRAFVNLLNLDLQPFDPAAVRDRPDGSLLAFVDHREAVGATATILTEYVVELDVEVDSTLATALAGRPSPSTRR